jgi:hypothetical protein
MAKNLFRAGNSLRRFASPHRRVAEEEASIQIGIRAWSMGVSSPPRQAKLSIEAPFLND